MNNNNNNIVARTAPLSEEFGSFLAIPHVFKALRHAGLNRTEIHALAFVVEKSRTSPTGFRPIACRYLAEGIWCSTSTAGRALLKLCDLGFLRRGKDIYDTIYSYAPNPEAVTAAIAAAVRDLWELPARLIVSLHVKLCTVLGRAFPFWETVSQNDRQQDPISDLENLKTKQEGLTKESTAGESLKKNGGGERSAAEKVAGAVAAFAKGFGKPKPKPKPKPKLRGESKPLPATMLEAVTLDGRFAELEEADRALLHKAASKAGVLAPVPTRQLIDAFYSKSPARVLRSVGEAAESAVKTYVENPAGYLYRAIADEWGSGKDYDRRESDGRVEAEVAVARTAEELERSRPKNLRGIVREAARYRAGWEDCARHFGCDDEDIAAILSDVELAEVLRAAGAIA